MLPQIVEVEKKVFMIE